MIEAHLLPLTFKDATDPDPHLKLHPIGEIIRRSRSGQAALGTSIALAIGNAWFRFDSEILFPQFLSVFFACALILGGLVVWNVQYLAKLLPVSAAAAEKAALAAIFFAYFAVVNAFLGGMTGIGALPWACLIVCSVLVNVKVT